ncbi:tyrosine-type recombinase/integrase [Priestia endophytica]
MEAKVLNFNSVKTDDYKVYKEIEDFLKYSGVNSSNTSDNYRVHINTFFNYRKQNIEFLSVEDIQIDKKVIENYIVHLKDTKGYASSTIKTKVDALKSLYKHFYGEGLIGDLRCFEAKTYKKLKVKNEEIDAFTSDEIKQMVQMALEEKDFAESKYSFLKLAAQTSYRKGDLLNLTWNDFACYEDYVLVYVRNPKSGVPYANKISHEMYNDILNLKSDKDTVFNFSEKTVERMIERFIEKLAIKDGRILSFHSIRKFAITNFYSITKDFVATQTFANHADPSTTRKYIRHVDDYGLVGIFAEEQDTKELDEISNDELRLLINSLPEGDKLKLIRQYRKLFNK